MTNEIDVLLIYPHLGSWDNIFCDIPLSVIYAASESVKQGLNVKILDMRLHPQNWEAALEQYLSKGCSLIGISIMTGFPILTSLKVCQYIKERYDYPIVFGGPHPTILPEETLSHPLVDYIIRDWGSKPLAQLVRYIKGEGIDITSIVGLGYKINNELKLNTVTDQFEYIHYLDIPYHLIEINENYKRLLGQKFIFPIFSSTGCPYKCTFCVSPAMYDKVQGKKWIAYEEEEVLDHIGHLDKSYKFDRIQVYDDDAFVNLKRKHKFLQGYIERGFHEKYKIDFRGVRANEIDRMDDDYLKLMAKANVQILMIGAESGSNEILKRMKKLITVEQTIRINKKLADYPTIRPLYNLFCGSPGETLSDLLKTRDLMLQLVKDNPHCYLGVASDWKPIPGTEMTERAVKEFNIKLPNTLEGWGKIDSFDAEKIVHPWYTKEMDNTIKLLQIAGQLLDGKTKDFRGDLGPLLGGAIYYLSRIYRPILLLRLRYNFNVFLIEYPIQRYMIKNVGKIKINLEKAKEALSTRRLYFKSHFLEWLQYIGKKIAFRN